MSDPRLFDVSGTTLAVCPVCGASRNPDQDRAKACSVDRDRQAGVFAGRPVRCLNFPKPDHQEIPF